MFKNLQFIFIGKFKNRKHNKLKKMITNRNGKCVVNCTKNTNFIVIPNYSNYTKQYSNNKQINAAKQMKKPIVHLNFILNCIKEKRIVNYKKYLVDEFKQDHYENKNNQVYQYEYSPNYYQFVNLPTWRVYYHNNIPYYYNTITGNTQWDIPQGPELIVYPNELFFTKF